MVLVLHRDWRVLTDQNILLCLLTSFLGQERGMPVKTFVQDDANALLVASTVVLEPLHDLRSHVLAGAHDRIRRSPRSRAVAPVDQMS